MSSIFPAETAQTIADAVGINLSDEVAEALLQDVEYRMREVVHEARKFMRHAKRNKLWTDDVNHALRVRNVEPLYGSAAGTSAKFEAIPMPANANAKMYYMEDREVDLEELVYGPLPPVPVDIIMTAHWLAVEGVQPAIIQNPNPSAIDSANKADRHIGPEPTSATASALGGVGAGVPGSEKLLVKGSLSVELQMYYERVADALLSGNQDMRRIAIDCIEKDAGIQPLMPYFVQFITEKVTKNLRNLPILWAMMRTTRGLFLNSNIFIEPHLHQLIPNIITCMVSKRLSQTPQEDHWSLREYSAQIAAHACSRFGSMYHTLQPRVTKTLLKAVLEPLKGYGTLYGALCGLAALGNVVVGALLEPNVKAIGAVMMDDVGAMETEGPGDEAGKVRRMEAMKCFKRVVKIVSEYLHEENERVRTADAEQIREVIGDQYGLFTDGIVKKLVEVSQST
ncbi:hypothetical protein BJ742DRAFT_389102 [Cladochytrium replicatum]|nr:hypothetical protein BJ742DRAFT_389102 [Cladochytrium replicatum]